MAEGAAPKQGQRPPRPRRRRARSAVDKVRDVTFPVGFRGYERSAVDAHLADIAQLVAELESRQLRENVVQKALDEVGEQTSSILRRAHETAEEVDARSRSQAEGRIQRAEREADAIRREAEVYAEEVAADARSLWEERARLLEELRQFAEEVLGLADVASDRLSPPPEPGSETQPHDETAETQSQDETPQDETPTPQQGGPSPEDSTVEVPAAQREDGGPAGP